MHNYGNEDWLFYDVFVIINPIRHGFFGCLDGGGVPAVHNPKTIHGIEMKFGRVVENHKLISFV